MGSLEVNKGVAAVLVAGIAFFLTGTLGDVLVHNTMPAKTAITIEMPQAAPAGGAAAPAGPPNIDNLIATADPAKGEAFTKTICVACHNFAEGGPAGVGPNLYNVVGGPHAHMAGFNYSNALKAHKGPWTYEALNQWLYDPAAYAPGTRMTYSGIKNNEQRAEVIAYLRSLSPKPLPLPPHHDDTPAATPASAPGGAAAGGVSGENLPPLVPLLASADPAKGEAYTKTICVACHTFTEGGPAGVGPNLYNVVGGPHAHMAGFNYTAGMKAKKGPWTFAELNEWLYKPSAYVPGTRMIFPGIPNAQTRANVVDYLRTLSPHPLPLPTTEAQAETEARPGDAK
jgi:cytochrome c